MTEQDLLDLIARLSEHRTLGSAPSEELAWLAAHGSIRELDADEVLSVKGRPVEALYILLSGRLALFVDRGSGPDKVSRTEFQVRLPIAGRKFTPASPV